MTDTLLPSELPQTWGFSGLDPDDMMDLQQDEPGVRTTISAIDASQALHAILRLDDMVQLSDDGQPPATADADIVLSSFVQKQLAVGPGAAESTIDEPMHDAADTDASANNEMVLNVVHTGAEDNVVKPDVHHEDHAMVDSDQQGFNVDEPMDDARIEEDEINDYHVLFGSNQQNHNASGNGFIDDDELFGAGFAYDNDFAPKHNYALRPGFRSDVVPWGAEKDDHDDTADFSPAEEERRLRHANRRRKPAPRARLAEGHTSDDDDDDSSGQDRPQIEYLPWPKIEVRLQFKAEDVKARYGAMIAKIEAEMLAALQAENREGRKLRDRAKNIGAVQPGIKDHLGHPEARGCRHCYESGEACALLENEFDWPCEACKDAGRVCTMVVPPARKLACERCISLGKRDQNLVCSFAAGGEQADSCQNCQEHGYSCAARPDPATIQPRIRIDSDGMAFSYERPEILVQPAAADERPSIGAWLGESSLFVPEDFDSASDELEPIPEPEPEPKPEPSEPQSPVQARLPPIFTKSAYQVFQEARAKRPMCMKLKTKFCHPMVFDHVPTTAEPCLFCSDSKFKYYGYGEKTPLVKELSNGQGWKELKDGHAANGWPRTKVCQTCTCERGDIICCNGHRIEQIHKWDKIGFSDFLETVDLGCDDMHDICSVCISIARWECATLNERGDDELPGRCGLKLCEMCYVTLLAFEGNLTQMLTEISDRTSKNRPKGLRADYQLLKDDGLLCRFLTQQ